MPCNAPSFKRELNPCAAIRDLRFDGAMDAPKRSGSEWRCLIVARSFFAETLRDSRRDFNHAPTWHSHATCTSTRAAGARDRVICRPPESPARKAFLNSPPSPTLRRVARNDGRLWKQILRCAQDESARWQILRFAQDDRHRGHLRVGVLHRAIRTSHRRTARSWSRGS